MDSRWWSQPTPFGDIVVVLGPRGVERIRMPDSTDDDPGGRPRRDREIARLIDAVVDGRRAAVDVPVDLEPAALSDLQRTVLMTVRAEVPFGETVTYGEVAEMIGRPRAARAVGTAMARNPVPLVIPCHRVVAANGIGGYGGGREGIALKRELLDREGRARPRC